MGCDLVKTMAVLEAAVELSDHAVQEVTLVRCGASRLERPQAGGGLAPGEAVIEVKARGQPTSLSRSFFTHRLVMGEPA